MITVNISDADSELECRRPFDGYYNGALSQTRFQVCEDWQNVIFHNDDSATTAVLRDIALFGGANSWDDIGSKCM